MLVVEGGATLADAVNQYWNLTDFSEDDGKNVVFLARQPRDRVYYEKYQHYENKMFLIVNIRVPFIRATRCR